MTTADILYTYKQRLPYVEINLKYSGSVITGNKGQRQVREMTSRERGTTVTVECAMNAAGSFIPLMMIFPRKRMAEGLMRDAATGAIATVSDSSWTDRTSFLRWLQHISNDWNNFSLSSTKQILS